MREPSGCRWLSLEYSEVSRSLWELDINDPATKGLLLQAIREKYEDDKISVSFSGLISAWMVTRHGYNPIESYVSEGDALIRAWRRKTWG